MKNTPDKIKRSFIITSSTPILMMENFHQVQNSINEILQHMWTKLEILQVQNSDSIFQIL
nr:MAG TPA: hypothetical protein [Caudoviricetes sp.]